MTRCRVRIAAAALVVLLAGVPAAQAARPTLTPGGTSAFGHTSFVLTLPHGAKVPVDGTLTENGQQVRDVTVTPAASVPGSYGVVLLVDASSRRAGKAIQGELAAARAFVANRPAGMPMAIVTYNSVATVAAPFTTQQQPLENALRQPPPLARGVHVVDAAAAALQLIRGEKLGGGAIVTLAGEPDDGSTQNATVVTKHALHAGVWIFGASLAAGRPAGDTIDALTPDGVGQNLGEMSGPGLVQLLGSLGQQTGGAAVLSYLSQAPPGSDVTVEFQSAEREVRTTTVLAGHVAPHPVVRHDAGTTPARTSHPHATALDSVFGRGAVSVAVVVLLFGGFAPVAISLRKRKEMRGRVARYASDAAPTTKAVDFAIGRESLKEHQLLGGERMRKLGDILDIARLQVSPGQLVLRTLVAAILAGWLMAKTSGIPAAGAMAFIGVPVLVRLIVLAKLTRQRRMFADQLADALQAAASALRAGHSFTGALNTMVDEAPEPTRTEFLRIVAAERIGIPLDQAFEDTIKRMDNRDVQQVALVAQLQRETGGNAAEAVERVVENLRGRDDVRRLVHTLTSQGRMSRWVLTAIPVGLGVMLTTMNGDYMAPLFDTNLGRVALGAAVLMCMAGSAAIGKIVDIEV